METKATPRFFEGIKYIPSTDLPNDQLRLFTGWASAASYLDKAGVSMIGSSDLIKYEDYEYWFDNYYLTEKDWDQLI
jgi:hypothetical protein